MNQVYFGLFSSSSDVFNYFETSKEQSEGVEILYAEYDCADWEGYAHVIFRKEDKLYEVNGSHCSCAGLEGQWEPEETSVIALLSRPNVSAGAKEILRQL